jgi:hypothetical protein
VKRFALLLAAAALLLHILPISARSEAAFSVAMEDSTWESINHEYCRFASKQQLIEEVSGYVRAIAEITGKSNWQDSYPDGNVQFEIVFTAGGSHVEGGYYSFKKMIPHIYINRTMAEYDLGPLAHESTHLICPTYSSLSLRESLASYIQDKIGKNCSIFNYGVDVHIYAQLYLDDDNEDIIDLMGSGDLPKSEAIATGEKRAIFYLCSYSFSKYLIGQYGIQDFMKLYESHNLQKECKLILGEDIKSLVDDWIQYLRDYPVKMTREEIEQQITQTLELHGYKSN